MDQQDYYQISICERPDAPNSTPRKQAQGAQAQPPTRNVLETQEIASELPTLPSAQISSSQPFILTLQSSITHMGFHHFPPPPLPQLPYSVKQQISPFNHQVSPFTLSILFLSRLLPSLEEMMQNLPNL